MPGKLAIELTVNGKPCEGFVEPRLSLADFLRDHLGLTGTHLGCEQGICGSCTILFNGETVRSCLLLAIQANGGEVQTVEGLAGLAKSGEALHPILTTATGVAQLNNGVGLPLGRVRLALGSQFATVDLSSATTIGEVIGLLNASGLPVEARINAAQTGIEIYSLVDDRSFIVTSDDSLLTAEKLGIVGSPDVFGSLYLLRQALEQNNRDLVRTTNESLQGALDQVVFERSRTGSRQIRLEATDYKLLEQHLNVTRLRSEYEDADILALSSDLSKQEAVYQAALAAAARMIQPSLAQFLR